MVKFISLNQNNVIDLSSIETATDQQQYNKKSIHFQLIPDKNIILYYGYSKPKANDLPNNQPSGQTNNQQSKPKKKFNFKAGKDKQAKTNESSSISSKVNIFDIKANSWKKQQLKGKTPIPRQNAQTLTLNQNLILMYGGKNIESNKILNDLHVFNIETLTWKKLFSIQCPAVNQNNVVVKMSSTKIALINMKQVWTFETKDVKWEINTNQLPGGVWQNHFLSLQSLVVEKTQNNMFLLNGININEQKKQILVYILDKQSGRVQTYLVSINQKFIQRVNYSSNQQIQIPLQDIEDLSISNNLLLFKSYSVKSNQKNDIKQIMNVYATSSSSKMVFMLYEYDDRNGSFQLSLKDKKQINKKNNILSYCLNQITSQLFQLSEDLSNPKKKCLTSLQIKFQSHQKHQQRQHTKPKPQSNSLQKSSSINYLNSSSIHSIPEQSNQSSLIGVRSSKYHNQYQQQQQEQNDKYGDISNSEYILENNSSEVFHSKNNHNLNDKYSCQREEEQVNRSLENLDQSDSGSEVQVQKNSLHVQNKSIYNKSQAEINLRKSESHENHQKQNLYDSNIYTNFNNSDLHQKTANQMQNASSSPYQIQLTSTLQKLLVFEHIKRTKLQQKSFILQKSIKKAQTLSKLLTKYASNGQKNRHIEQVKYLKNQLQTIWNKQIFYKKQIDMNFVQYDRQSITKEKQSARIRQSSRNKENIRQNKGKIDMKKLLKKHLSTVQ